MKYILIILLLTTCMSKELQVGCITAIVIEITPMERMGVEDRVWIHFKADNNIDYYLATDANDTNYYKVNTRYPFLVNK